MLMLWMSEMKSSRLGLHPTVPAQQYKHSLFLLLLLPSIFDQTKTKTKMATLCLALDILKNLVFNPQGKMLCAENKRNKLKRNQRLSCDFFDSLIQPVKANKRVKLHDWRIAQSTVPNPSPPSIVSTVFDHSLVPPA